MVGLGIQNKVRSAKGTSPSLGFIPHRGVRLDLFYVDDPVEHVCRTIGGIADQALRPDAMILLDLLNHGPGGLNLLPAIRGG